MKLKTLKKKNPEAGSAAAGGSGEAGQTETETRSDNESESDKGHAKSGRSRIQSSSDGQIFDAGGGSKRPPQNTTSGETGRRDEANWKESEEKT
jgi:hypothetical protein